MSDVTTWTALADDPAMPRRTKSTYIPPPHCASIVLSEALRGTSRFPKIGKWIFWAGKDRNDLDIYYAGDLSLLQCPSVAIVGTREASESGLSATEWLTRKLVGSGITIVSGWLTALIQSRTARQLNAGAKQ